MLERYDVRLLGTPLETIRKAEDRELFKQLLREIGEPVPPSAIVRLARRGAARSRDEIGLPLIIRPAYTLGGTGGGIAHDRGRVRADRRSAASQLSPIDQVLVERSWPAGKRSSTR